MDAGQLHRLARQLRAIAVAATADDPDESAAASPSMIAVVEDIADHPGSSITDVATRTGLAQSMVSKTVAGLRDYGLVTTSTDPADRRRTVVVISDQVRGTVLQPRGRRSIDDALRSAHPGLTVDQRRELSEHLDRVADLLGFTVR